MCYLKVQSHIIYNPDTNCAAEDFHSVHTGTVYASVAQAGSSRPTLPATWEAGRGPERDAAPVPGAVAAGRPIARRRLRHVRAGAEGLLRAGRAGGGGDGVLADRIVALLFGAAYRPAAPRSPSWLPSSCSCSRRRSTASSSPRSAAALLHGVRDRRPGREPRPRPAAHPALELRRGGGGHPGRGDGALPGRSGRAAPLGAGWSSVTLLWRPLVAAAAPLAATLLVRESGWGVVMAGTLAGLAAYVLALVSLGVVTRGESAGGAAVLARATAHVIRRAVTRLTGCPPWFASKSGGTDNSRLSWVAAPGPGSEEQNE